ncbi:MAG: hypothetical protein JWN44_3757 [Myxococcales bacterium]|nr:hypothetical protein [Myxococcales bacterium]
MTTRLPVVLDKLRIATPCKADWDDMKGDDRVRFCGRCEKNVYNLSEMTRADAEALVREKEGRMCVRLYQRTDGTVLTNDCPVGVRRARLRQRVWASVSGVAASVALALGLFSGRARADLTIGGDKTQPAQQPQPHRVLMGGPVARPPELLMGKIKMPDPPKPPKKPPATMGEPMPIMGDIAVDRTAK